MKIIYFIETVDITVRTHFLRVHLSISSKKYEAIARVNIDNPKCRKLIWKGERPNKLTEDAEKAIKEECVRQAIC